MYFVPYFSIAFLTIAAIHSSYAIQGKLQCKMAPAEISKEWITMSDPCTEKMKAQVQVELTAALTYLAMGAHFARDTVNRPGFAKYFFHSASEEREHAIKFIGYLLMRGNLTTNIGELIRNPQPRRESWVDGISALRDALDLETEVTRKIIDIAKTCEDPGLEGKDFNDYHLVDWLSGDMMTEQYTSQREIAGHISELGKMIGSHGPLAEFLFDKKLLNGEPTPIL